MPCWPPRAGVPNRSQAIGSPASSRAVMSRQAAGAAQARARRAASRPWTAPMAAARLRAVWPPPSSVQPASWLARASASANRAAPAGASKVRASQEISGGSSGWPARAALTVMSTPWRGLPRGSPPGGAGSVTVTVTGPPPQRPADGFGHGEVVAVAVDVADHDRGAVHDAVPPDRAGGQAGGGWSAGGRRSGLQGLQLGL